MLLNFNNILSAQDAAPASVPALPESLPPQIDSLLRGALGLFERIGEQTLSLNGAIEVGAIVLCGLIAWLFTGPANRLLTHIWPAGDLPRSARARDVGAGLMLPILWLVMLWISVGLVSSSGFEVRIVRVASSLLNAWILIRLVSSFVADQALANAFALFAWTVAALNIFGWLQPAIALLDSIGFSFGATRLTLFLVIKGLLLAMLFLWAASAASGLVKGRLERSRRFTPSVRTLVAQAARLTLLFIAIMLSLNAIGIDLTALAVFSGAIGVGIGFGLQSIFSNLMAGIIMLIERTVKVGDFIEFDNGLAGEVREISIRATLVTTNDNVDILVPNAEFINNRVTNWTLREGFRRIRIPFGVAYGTDKDLVRQAALEAAENVPHMLTGAGAKPPQVWLTGFGDSSLDFELVVWLNPDAVKRPSAVNADYNWAIETALGKYGIEIPFPQRDLHFRSGRIPVQLNGDDASD